MKKALVFLLSLILTIGSLSLTVFAEEADGEGIYIDESGVTEEDPIRYDLIGIQPRWTYTSTTTLNLAYDGANAVCYVYISGKSNCVKISGDLILYKKVGSSYTRVVTWGGLTTTESRLSRERKWPVARGYTYKLVFSGRAYGIADSEPLYIQTESTFG